MRALLLSLLAAVVLAALPAGAPAAPVRLAPDIDLSAVAAKRAVRDGVLRPRARAAQALRTEFFLDEHGHEIRISTGLEGLGLAPYAGVLAATRHGAEIEDVRTEVALLAGIPRACGGGAGVVACYGADGAEGRRTGEILIAADDADWMHSLVHEYGHHVDNQLLNLNHIDADVGGCVLANDGSRNWFFEREVEDAILEGGVTCDPRAGWERLLGEVFAEDFVALNGIRNWTLRSVPPPTRLQLDALAGDMTRPFRPSQQWWAPAVAPGRDRELTLTLEQWSFLDVELKVPRGANFDLLLFAGGSSRPLARSAGRARREHVRELVPPGDYDVRVVARTGRGRATVVTDVD